MCAIKLISRRLKYYRRNPTKRCQQKSCSQSEPANQRRVRVSEEALIEPSIKGGQVDGLTSRLRVLDAAAPAREPSDSHQVASSAANGADKRARLSCDNNRQLIRATVCPLDLSVPLGGPRQTDPRR